VPINSMRALVQVLPAAPSLLDVDGPLEVAVVAVPAPAVLTVLKQLLSARATSEVATRRLREAIESRSVGARSR
jgi:acyl-CoA synthetase (NDP forming)